ncbi:MAG TPA: 1-acyl-sn-glycerol-3-phosphate acyltransferase, partial [Solirubrobacteraceae bacterium]|nr:1-acyl-sn-glycerol-3-phosphate acyltransferase [Solirubrobacteraceae bacterium]
FCHLYFRLSRIGREHIPAEGPFIIASNHRSFLDPFVIGMMARRPLYFLTKKEAFINRPAAWLLSSLGAYPIDRGSSDQEAMATTRAILERGDGVLIFPEGTRTRPGPLGRPKRGIGRLALDTGAPVVPVAIIGSEAVRKGWRIRPHKVRIRAGAPLTFPKVQEPSRHLAAAVTDRIWPCVELQWEWLGGTPRVRRAAVIGAGPWGTSLAVALARAGLEVDLGTRAEERPTAHGPLPAAVAVHRASEIALAHHDLVCLAVTPRELPAVVEELGSKIPERAGVLVRSKGLVAPLGTLPCAYVGERTRARAVACLGGPGAAAAELAPGAKLVVASASEAFLAQIADVLRVARFEVQRTTDVTGVELAVAARNAAVLAASAAAPAGASAADAAADRVLAEVDAYARRRGGRPEAFADLTGTGDSAQALDDLPLLAVALREDGVDAPAVAGLADVVAGRVEPEHWAAAVTEPTRTRSRRAA